VAADGGEEVSFSPPSPGVEAQTDRERHVALRGLDVLRDIRDRAEAQSGQEEDGNGVEPVPSLLGIRRIR
jgi:hypothetical protein